MKMQELAGKVTAASSPIAEATARLSRAPCGRNSAITCPSIPCGTAAEPRGAYPMMWHSRWSTPLSGTRTSWSVPSNTSLSE